jgi:hypothetical protein
VKSGFMMIIPIYAKVSDIVDFIKAQPLNTYLPIIPIYAKASLNSKIKIVPFNPF